MRRRIAVVIASTLGLIGVVIAPASAATKEVTVTASKSNISASGGPVTIHATVKSAKTCVWTSKPKVKGFDTSVKCAANLSRVAIVPANTTTSARRFTFSLDTVSGKVSASGSAIVSEAGKRGKTPALTGIGATVAQMKAAHGVDYIVGGLCSAAPHCFGVPIKNEEGAVYQFTGVMVDDGIVDGYTQAFENGTRIAQAESQVLQWMPKDAKMSPVTIDHNGGSCAVANITSATLANVFSSAPKVGDPRGIIGVEFGYINASLNQVYNPNNVEHAVLSVVPSNPTAAC